MKGGEEVSQRLHAKNMQQTSRNINLVLEDMQSPSASSSCTCDTIAEK